MQQNKLRKLMYTFITVLITVPAFVFYSLYVVEGSMLMEMNQTSTVLDAINKQGGAYMLGNMVPIWAVILIEFILAFLCQTFIGGRFAFKTAFKLCNPRETHPVLLETVIISCTVSIMCPLMSFLATILYGDFSNGFNILTFIANFIKTVCHNLPFAFFAQLLFIQPLVRKIIGLMFPEKNNEVKAQAA